MVGGEAGAEAILPLEMFWKKLDGFMQSSNSQAPNQTNYNEFNIVINAQDKTADQVLNEIITPLEIALTNM